MTTSYIDTTLDFIDDNLVSGVIKPAFVLRAATDSNYITKQRVQLTGYPSGKMPPSRAIMNSIIQGTSIPATSWSVSENLDSPSDSADLSMLNVLPKSVISTKLTSALADRPFHPTTAEVAIRSYDNGKVLRYTGTEAASDLSQQVGNRPGYNESQVLFRVMQDETFTITPGEQTKFPDPRVPSSEQDLATPTDTCYWPTSSTGVGSYFLLIDDEVVRVHNLQGNTFSIPSGGRAVNGIRQAHAVGATVTLLGFAPFTGEWVAPGYLTLDPKNPCANLLAPGTCLVSYEGYGQVGELNKRPWINGTQTSLGITSSNVTFTGYWFITDQSTDFAPDGQKKIQFSLTSSSFALSRQKITQEALFALHPGRDARLYDAIVNQVYTGSSTTNPRTIGGDNTSYTSWDPALPGSYPLQIKTEIAQHKAFFDHMKDSTNGTTCPICITEYNESKYKPAVGATANARQILARNKDVGKHIYKESLRVFNASASGQYGIGPILTYIGLPAKLAQVSWEQGSSLTALTDRWLKTPNDLWENLTTLDSGLIARGRLSFTQSKPLPEDTIRDWSNIPDDVNGRTVVPDLVALDTPFESAYDNQPWDQPARDLAEINQMQFNINRRGLPTMLPKNIKRRGLYAELQKYIAYGEQWHEGEWTLTENGSITSISHSLDVGSVVTLCVVSAQTAFDETSFNVSGAGTSYSFENGKAVQKWYSNKTGNPEALKLTGGLQQIDTVSLENLKLGFSWNTNPASFGLKLKRNDVKDTIEVDKKPSLPSLGVYNVIPSSKTSPDSDIYDPSVIPKISEVPYFSKGSAKSNIQRIQSALNFMLIRRYIPMGISVTIKNTKKGAKTKIGTPGLLFEDGRWSKYVSAYTKELKRFLRGDDVYRKYTVGGSPISSPLELYNLKYPSAPVTLNLDGYWTAGLISVFNNWLTDSSEAIAVDPWWYVINGYDWDYYVASIVGLPVNQARSYDSTSSDPLYIFDNNALKASSYEWAKNFAPQAISVANKVVDDSILAANQFSVSALADPRIELGDVLSIQVPGMLSSLDAAGNDTGAPYYNKIYVTQISRSLDLTTGDYTATYSGHAYQPFFEDLTGSATDSSAGRQLIYKGEFNE